MTAADNEIRVYYNSACPVCNAGISHQQKKMSGCRIQWTDVHADNSACQKLGLELEFVRERLHATDANGAMKVGIDAIELIWHHSPGELWKARLISLPGVKQVSTILYNAFARVLYNWNRRMHHW